MRIKKFSSASVVTAPQTNINMIKRNGKINIKSQSLWFLIGKDIMQENTHPAVG